MRKTYASPDMMRAREMVRGGAPVAEAARLCGINRNALAVWASLEGLTRKNRTGRTRQENNAMRNAINRRANVVRVVQLAGLPLTRANVDKVSAGLSGWYRVKAVARQLRQREGQS